NKGSDGYVLNWLPIHALDAQEVEVHELQWLAMSGSLRSLWNSMSYSRAIKMSVVIVLNCLLAFREV
ncbi:hypothetical protein HAX54_042017, partial [Datura stramonium]|nr:hypothetical protein [Datura stramonium]